MVTAAWCSPADAGAVGSPTRPMEVPGGVQVKEMEIGGAAGPEGRAPGRTWWGRPPEPRAAIPGPRAAIPGPRTGGGAPI
ncbi:hypothetical protein NDU88_003763 [Pleurodeles waltl]|uniref:Uncharacterized protein n=1 Tax=Pleurodeles waltl TaxID=8319 RepID=A0AAV7M4E4_PLEWA|nr:hypothetical protein NDU88_003763 [Pleurodeles waltl]